MSWLRQVLRESPECGEFGGHADLEPTCTGQLCGVRVQQRNKMAEGAALPVLALKPDNEVPPSVSLVLSELLPSTGSQSEYICHQVSPCVHPLRVTPGPPEVLYVTQMESLLIIMVKCCGDSCSQH